MNRNFYKSKNSFKGEEKNAPSDILYKTKGEYWQKNPTWRLLREGGHPPIWKIQNTEGQHTEISNLRDCNRFFFK